MQEFWFVLETKLIWLYVDDCKLCSDVSSSLLWDQWFFCGPNWKLFKFQPQIKPNWGRNKLKVCGWMKWPFSLRKPKLQTYCRNIHFYEINQRKLLLSLTLFILICSLCAGLFTCIHITCLFVLFVKWLYDELNRSFFFPSISFTTIQDS